MSRLAEALAGVARLGFDTAPFIYFIERHPHYTGRLREIYQRVDTGTLAGFSSVVTLTEVLTRPRQVQDTALEGAYRDLLLHSRHFTLIPIDAAIAANAAALRAQYRLRTPDALQIAAAQAVGCEAFLTNDAALRRVTELRVLVLDDLVR